MGREWVWWDANNRTTQKHVGEGGGESICVRTSSMCASLQMSTRCQNPKDYLLIRQHITSVCGDSVQHSFERICFIRHVAIIGHRKYRSTGNRFVPNSTKNRSSSKLQNGNTSSTTKRSPYVTTKVGVCLWKDTASRDRSSYTTFKGRKIQSHVLWILFRNNKSGIRYRTTGFSRINQLAEMGQSDPMSKHSLSEAHLSSLLIPLVSISIQRQMVTYLIRK